MKMNILDVAISYISPKAGLQRAKLRAQEAVIRSAKRSYEGATKGRRGDGWTSNGANNQNLDIMRALPALRERSIDAYKNNPTVFKIIRTIQNNVVGTGIMPTPVSVVGQKALTDKEIQKIKAAWELFAKTCDFDGMANFFGQQSMGMRTVAMQGEIFVVRQRDASAVIPFKLQILSPHMCDHNKNSFATLRSPDNYVVQGVEFDKRGRKVGYWMHEYNPNNEFILKLAPKFVSVDDVLQVFYKEYPEQVRGIPFGTSAMLNTRDLADYEDAQLMLQKVAACHVAFTTMPQPEAGTVGVEGTEEDARIDVDHMEPGMIQHMAPGEEVTFNNPPTPQSYAEYVSKNQQKTAAGFGVTYEQATGDMSNVNFSSGRMGWIEAQRQIEDWQYNMFIPQFCDKVWDWFVEGMKMANIIPQDRKVGAEWTPQGREMIDPVKEMNGLILELKSGLVSWTEACKRRGYNPDVLMDQMKKDKKLFEEAGINVDWIIAEAAQDPENGGGQNKAAQKT